MMHAACSAAVFGCLLLSMYRIAISRCDVQDLPEKPFQPCHYRFPSRLLGKATPVKHTFQSLWFHRFKWIHYDVTLDAAFCFSCCKASKEGKVRLTGISEQSFMVKGFTNWKDATRVFMKHKSSEFHK